MVRAGSNAGSVFSKFIWLYLLTIALPVNVSGCVEYMNDPLSRWNRESPALMAEASEKSVEELVEQLESVDAFQRCAAFYTLEKFGADKVLPILLSNDPHKHQSYLLDLVKSWGPEAVPSLINIISEPRPAISDVSQRELHRRSFAITCLVELGSDAVEAKSLLLSLLNQHYTIDDAQTVNADLICMALASIGYTTVSDITPLLSATDDGYSSIAIEACYALGELAEPGDQLVIDHLETFIYGYESSPDDLGSIAISARAAQYKMGYNQDTNINIIIEAATDTTLHSGSSIFAWQALAYIGTEKAIQILTETVLHPDSQDIGFALYYLCTLGPEPEIIDALIELTGDPNSNICWPAVNYLGSFEDNATNALSPLLELYENLKTSEDEEDQIEGLSSVEEAIIRIGSHR